MVCVCGDMYPTSHRDVVDDVFKEGVGGWRKEKGG